MIVVLVALTLVGAVLGLGLGGFALALPSFALVAVLLAARRAPRGRYRWIAVLAGGLAFAAVERGLLLGPVVLLLTGGVASVTRNLFPARTGFGRFLVAAAFALLAALLAAFLAPGGASSLGPLEGVVLLGSIAATAAVYVAAEAALDRSPLLRHALERP